MVGGKDPEPANHTPPPSSNSKNGYIDCLIEEEEGINNQNVFIKCVEIQSSISEGRDGDRGSSGGQIPTGFLQSPHFLYLFTLMPSHYPFYILKKKKNYFLIKFKNCSHLYFLYNCMSKLQFFPLCIKKFQFSPLSIKLSNVLLYLLKLSNLLLTFIFLLNTNRTSTII